MAVVRNRSRSSATAAVCMWVFDGQTWERVSTSNPPPRRMRHAMVYDSGRSVAVLFGGFDGDYLSDTWEFDGADWSQADPAVSPPGRREHGMAYDAHRGRVVLFGGTRGFADGTTWEFDGTIWAKNVTEPHPQGRGFYGITYDPDQQEVVLFGGHHWDFTSRYLGDLWWYDGARWILMLTGGGPRGRESMAFAFHHALRQVVMFGGHDGASLLNDTWMFRVDSGWPDEICDDSVDNDLDGATDCEDPDCVGPPCG